MLHTTASDWAKQQVAGITATFAECKATVIEVVDCGFAPDAQINALDRLRGERPDAIISIPALPGVAVSSESVAESWQNLSVSVLHRGSPNQRNPSAARPKT